MSLESGYTGQITIHRPDGDLTIVVETWADGDLQGNSAKHRNPVTRKETARGGLATRNDLTLTRECDDALWALKDKIEDSVGKDRCTCVRLMVGPRGEVIGQGLPLTGSFDGAKFPDYDLGGDGVGMAEFKVALDEARA